MINCILCGYLGFCIGCMLISDLNYNNNLDYKFIFNKISWFTIIIRLVLSPVLVPLIFIDELSDYLKLKDL